MQQDWRRGEFTISTDRSRIDLDAVHAFLADSYWAKDIPRHLVAKSIEHSLVFGLYHGDRQIGFARVVTDRATFAYLADVYVLEAWRGRGLGSWLIETVQAHDELQGLRRWVLLTRDAHALYRRAGWTEVANPDRYMERWTPGIYTTKTPGADAR